MSVPSLRCEGIGKSFFGVPALQGIDFELPAGHILGLIGQNGAGKSTLMNILGGVIPASAGTMQIDGADYAPRSPRDAARRGVAFIHQELNLFTNLSIAENIFIDGFPRLGPLPLINRGAMRARVAELLAAVDLNLSPDTLVERLAPGERQLVEIARALAADARIIIFDEPTTSLTARETERLFAIIERLRAAGTTMIYISHILGDVLRLADSIMVLRDGELVGAGPRAEWGIDRMINLMVGRSIGQLYPSRASAPAEDMALEVHGLSQSGIVEGVSFQLRRGEILGLFGLMGSGRTELARILFGLDPYERGEILVGGEPLARHSARDCIGRKMAFVTENRRDEGLLMDVAIAENLALVALPAFASRGAGLLAQARLAEAAEQVSRRMQIKSGPIAEQPVKSLSGGNQQKVVIGKWLMAEPALVIFDEPTRGIDVGAKYEVYSVTNDLAARGAGVLFISSELDELIGVCDRILVMSNGELQGCFGRGDFDRERILRAAFREVSP